MPGLTVPGLRDTARWDGRFRVAKFWADDDPARATPYEIIESGPNLLLTGGVTALWQRLVGTGPTVFDVTNARLAVGDSTAVAAAGQTDLQGTNKFRQIVDSAPVISGNQITYVATFGTAVANFAWNEAGIANSASGATMLNRVVQFFGTKTSSVQWVLTGSVTIS